MPKEWEFSNYREWMNPRAGSLVNRDFIKANFGTLEAYKALVMDYIKQRYLPDDAKNFPQEFE